MQKVKVEERWRDWKGKKEAKNEEEETEKKRSDMKVLKKYYFNVTSIPGLSWKASLHYIWTSSDYILVSEEYNICL